VLKIVLAESLAMGVMGCVFGLVFGYLISVAFVRALVALSSYEVTYLFTLRPYVLSALIALGVSQFAGMGPAWRAARTNIIAAIKHE
jgi:ABC-type antimicrobial peptide transport system permease subunit